MQDTQDTTILSFLLLAPPRSYTVKELSQRIGMKESETAQNLGELVKLGQVKTFLKRGSRYYLINTRAENYLELQKSYAKTTPKYDDELFVAIKKLGDIRLAVLTGIFTGRPESIVDLLFVGRVSGEKLGQFMSDCESMMGQELNYCVMGEEEFVLRKNGSDKFIRDILDYHYVEVVNRIK